MNIYQASYDCLMESDPVVKCQCATQLYADWQQGAYSRDENDTVTPVMRIKEPGRPARPQLVPVSQVKQRKLSSDEGRASLIHAVTHIEFNAINLALDAVYRFRDMPDAYYGDWLQVAKEEAYHFNLLKTRLQEMGYAYGDLPAHNGLWESCVDTDHDVMVRMALVPRVLEARGLDVTPAMMQRLLDCGDTPTVELLEIILRDEVGHVRIGSRWFHYCCEQRKLEPQATFVELIKQYMSGGLRGPFNESARLQAGFSEKELQMLTKLSL